jgi:hypothetical protein
LKISARGLPTTYLSVNRSSAPILSGSVKSIMSVSGLLNLISISFRVTVLYDGNTAAQCLRARAAAVSRYRPDNEILACAHDLAIEAEILPFSTHFSDARELQEQIHFNSVAIGLFTRTYPRLRQSNATVDHWEAADLDERKGCLGNFDCDAERYIGRYSGLAPRILFLLPPLTLRPPP